MNIYKEIVKELLEEIKNGKFKVNDKLPSEKALVIRYSVSRIVISRVFAELKKIGAIYSISKKGNFVAKYFHGLIKPLHFPFDIDNIIDMETDIKKPYFFEEQGISGEYKTFLRKYYKNNKLIIESQCWMNDKVKYIKGVSIIDSIMDDFEIESSIIISKFEKYYKNDKKNSLVNYKIIYDKIGVILIYRYRIDEEHYISYKQEFSI